MFNMLKNRFNNMDTKVKKIMKYGLFFSLIMCLLSLAILLTYSVNPYPDLYYIGLSTFKLSLFFVVEFIICAIAIDTIKEQLC